MGDSIYKHKKKIIIGLVVGFLMIIAISIYGIIENSPGIATVEITVSPLTAKIKIDGKEYDATETAKIKPGTYSVEISADGFVTKNIEIEAQKDKIIELSLYLDPTEENKDWYKDNVWDGTARGDIISDNDINEFYALQEKYPILNYVPYNTFTYAISYEKNCADNDGGICLVIDADYGFRRYAVQYLQSTNQDLANYYAKVKGYNLPFQQIEIEVTGGFNFSGAESGAVLDEVTVDGIRGAVDGYVNEAFGVEGYGVEIGQVKKYNDKFYGVILRVYSNDGNAMYDEYRMIIGKTGDEYRALTNADIILSKYKNPLIPEELLRLVNNF